MRDREVAKKRAEELVSQMTVEERASQLRYDSPAIPDWEFQSITGGMRLFTEWQEGDVPPAFLRLLD